DASSIYEVPLILEKEGLAQQTLDLLQMEQREPDLTHWETMVERMSHPQSPVEIAIVGKYVRLGDAYLSVVESLRHAAIATYGDLRLRWVNSEILEVEPPDNYLLGVDGIIVPGGFGIRGVDGKISAIEYARNRQIPFLGLCLGMQCSIIEWARNVEGLVGANSAEFNPQTDYP
ncbi:MAG: glutamine amidotransferase-related protein, partial [Synechococcales cyanobacterium]